MDLILIPKYIYRESFKSFTIQWSWSNQKILNGVTRYGELSGNQTAEIMRMGATRAIMLCYPWVALSIHLDSTLIFIKKSCVSQKYCLIVKSQAEILLLKVIK